MSRKTWKMRLVGVVARFASSVSGDLLVLEVDIDRLATRPDPDLLAHQPKRYGIESALKFNMDIRMDSGALPDA